MVFEIVGHVTQRAELYLKIAGKSLFALKRDLRKTRKLRKWENEVASNSFRVLHAFRSFSFKIC